MKPNDRSEVFAVLRSAGWLQGYPDDLIVRLVSGGRLARLSTGEWAQAEGDDRPGLSVVVSGQLHSYCAAPGDREVLIGLVGPGSVIGHATRYSGGPRLVTAVCVEPSTLLELSEEALERIGSSDPQIWQAIAGFAYAHMRSAVRMAAEVISLRPRERIAARLLAFHDHSQATDAHVIKVSQELLCEMMGLTRKTINHHLSNFEAAELIKIGYGKIELVDVRGLKLIADRTSG